MRIPRFYCSQNIVLDTPFLLDGEAAHHAASVLRLKPDQAIVLFNGDGNEYSATITDVDRRKVTVTADACLALTKESPLSLHLGQGIAKGDRMETVLQKSVELGVTEITPLITERCNVKLDEKRWQKKYEQWLKILHGACEQSGRNVIPTLHPATPLAPWLAQSSQQTRVILAPGSEKALSGLDYNHHGFRLLIGPEGGLSESEVRQASELGFQPCTMGPRILRTETAALASISILQAQHGDI